MPWPQMKKIPHAAGATSGVGWSRLKATPAQIQSPAGQENGERGGGGRTTRRRTDHETTQIEHVRHPQSADSQTVAKVHYHRDVADPFAKILVQCRALHQTQLEGLVRQQHWTDATQGYLGQSTAAAQSESWKRRHAA